MKKRRFISFLLQFSCLYDGIFIRCLKVPYKREVSEISLPTPKSRLNFPTVGKFPYVWQHWSSPLLCGSSPSRKKKSAKRDLRKCPRMVHSRIMSAQYIIPERQSSQSRETELGTSFQQVYFRGSQRHLSGNKLIILKKGNKILGKLYSEIIIFLCRFS